MFVLVGYLKKRVFQCAVQGLVLFCIVMMLGKPVSAGIQISVLDDAPASMHSRFLLLSDRPVQVDSVVVDAPPKVEIKISGREAQVLLESFFGREFLFESRSCVTKIQARTIADDETVLTFTLKQGLLPTVFVEQTRNARQFRTVFDVYPRGAEKGSCSGLSDYGVMPAALLEKMDDAARWSSMFSFGGYLMVDFGDAVRVGGDFDKDDVGFEESSEIRRARVSLKGRIDNWKYRLRLDLTDVLQGDGEAEFSRAYVGYDGWRGWEIRMGLMPEPFGLEKSISSKNVTFMERSLTDVFMPEDNLGLLAIARPWQALHIEFGAFRKRPYPEGSNTTESLDGRVAWAPVNQGGKLWHLGASYSHRRPIDNRVRYRERPEAHLAERLFNSGRIKNVDHIGLIGVEAAWVHGPLSLQGEYIQSRIKREADRQDRQLDAFYLYLSWFLTGESRPYANASFGRIRPQHRVGKGGWGAWELALRQSGLADDRGQRLSDATLGLNWYLTKRSRVMFNWIRADYRSPDTIGDTDIVQMRLQHVF